MDSYVGACGAPVGLEVVKGHHELKCSKRPGVTATVFSPESVEDSINALCGECRRRGRDKRPGPPIDDVRFEGDHVWVKLHVDTATRVKMLTAFDIGYDEAVRQICDRLESQGG